MTAAPSLNILVTGAARGIGRGLSRLLLSHGHRVLLVDNNSTELSHTTTQLSSSHRPGSAFDSLLCDLRKPSDVTSAAQKASQLFDGRLDVLVNNAAYTGGVGGVALADMTVEEWNKSIETNLTGPMLLCQACLPLLRKNEDRALGGSIVFMSSTRAHQSEKDSEAYATTKAGLIGLTHALAVSLADDGVRVNAILPGWIHVENECKEASEKGRKWEEGLTEDDKRWHLTGRVGKVEDIFKAVEYLATAEFVSGTEMVVDGGVTRKMVYPD